MKKGYELAFVLPQEEHRRLALEALALIASLGLDKLTRAGQVISMDMRASLTKGMLGPVPSTGDAHPLTVAASLIICSSRLRRAVQQAILSVF